MGAKKAVVAHPITKARNAIDRDASVEIATPRIRSQISFELGLIDILRIMSEVDKSTWLKTATPFWGSCGCSYM